MEHITTLLPYSSRISRLEAWIIEHEKVKSKHETYMAILAILAILAIVLPYL